MRWKSHLLGQFWRALSLQHKFNLHAIIYSNLEWLQCNLAQCNKLHEGGWAGWVENRDEGRGLELEKEILPWNLQAHCTHIYYVAFFKSYVFKGHICLWLSTLTISSTKIVFKKRRKKCSKRNRWIPIKILSDQLLSWWALCVCVCVNDRTLGKSVFIKIGRPGVLWHQAATIRERLTSSAEHKKVLPILSGNPCSVCWQSAI